jgi:hypothetical protein
MASAHGLKPEACAASIDSLATNSAGTFSTCRPSRSLNWLAKMITAMPDVKPVITGCGMYFIKVPTRMSPAPTSTAPAISVASTRPSKPWLAMMA